MSSGPLLSVNVREEWIVECYCQDRQETRLGVLETLKESLSIRDSNPTSSGIRNEANTRQREVICV